MEGLTCSPLRFVVGVGESHKGTSRNECTDQMERECISNARVKRVLSLSVSLSFFLSLSRKQWDGERRSKVKLQDLGCNPCHATNDLCIPAHILDFVSQFPHL